MMHASGKECPDKPGTTKIRYDGGKLRPHPVPCNEVLLWNFRLEVWVMSCDSDQTAWNGWKVELQLTFLMHVIDVLRRSFETVIIISRLSASNSKNSACDSQRPERSVGRALRSWKKDEMKILRGSEL